MTGPEHTPAPTGAETASLERRYRRLLVAYPASYRASKEDELVAVLLDHAQAEGRTRPSLEDRFDLLRGGLRARLNFGTVRVANGPWRHAVAVTTVMLPLFLALRALRPLSAFVGHGFTFPLWSGYGAPLWNQSGVQFDSIVADLLGGWIGAGAWVIAAVFVMLRRRRRAAIAATVGTVLEVAFVFDLITTHGPDHAHGVAVFVVIEVLATCLLWWPDGLTEGIGITGRRSLLAFMAFGTVLNLWSGTWWRGNERGLLVALAALVVLAPVARRNTHPGVAVRIVIIGVVVGLMLVIARQAGSVTEINSSYGSIALEIVLCLLCVVALAVAVVAPSPVPRESSAGGEFVPSSER